MKPTTILLSFLFTAALCSAVAALASGSRGQDPIPYPEDYARWTHVKSLLLEPDHALADPFAGIHHIYANDAALNGLDQGRFENGSMFAFDLFEAQSADHAVAEGPRKLLGVMVKDGSRFADTGGWGFEAFAGDSREQRLVTDGGISCFGCHQARKEQGYVFTEKRD